MKRSRRRGGSWGLVGPGVDAEVIDPGLTVIAGAILPAKQEPLVPAESDHGMTIPCRRAGEGTGLLRPGAIGVDQGRGCG